MKINPKTTVKITNHLEMVGFLRTNGTQSQFVSMLTATKPDLKKNCPYKNVMKISRRNGLINVDYNKSVRRRLANINQIPLKEATYENGNVWFTHEMTGEGKRLPLVVNKKTLGTDGKIYLQYFPLKSKQTKYVLPNGETVKEELLKPYFYSKSHSEFKPITCVFDIQNIVELRASNLIIQTEDTETVENIAQS